MLSKLRNFSKSKPAILLIVIIIIPFVFWGMGSVFSGGNTNNVAKINNKNISTQDFIKHINQSLSRNRHDTRLHLIRTNLIKIKDSIQFPPVEWLKCQNISQENYNKVLKHFNSMDSKDGIAHINRLYGLYYTKIHDYENQVKS